jgi:hypothetical protein
MGPQHCVQAELLPKARHYIQKHVKYYTTHVPGLSFYFYIMSLISTGLSTMSVLVSQSESDVVSVYRMQCCGSGFIESGSSISSEPESGSGSGVLMTNFFDQKLLLLIPRPPKKYLSYRRSLQPFKKNIQHVVN